VSGDLAISISGLICLKSWIVKLFSNTLGARRFFRQGYIGRLPVLGGEIGVFYFLYDLTMYLMPRSVMMYK